MDIKDKFLKMANFFESMLMTNHSCICCDREIADGTEFQLCTKCRKSIVAIEGNVCAKCGESLPDGVEICVNGIKSVKDKSKKIFLKSLPDCNFKLFKSNANAVDLNTNFDAKWGSGKDNKFSPSFSDYIGEMPMSEPEVQALARLTQQVKPCFTISYHAKGQEIYYEFFNKKENIKSDRKIAKMFARSLGYKIKNVQNQSGGGYKDWCIYRHQIPSITIEVGDDKLTHPIATKHLGKIYKQNKNVVKLLSKVVKEIKKDERIFYESCN